MATRLYFAYGSNTNPEQMAFRCPTARSLGAWKLPNWRLVFRMVADIEAAPGESAHGVLWEISEQDEACLDEFEGVEAGTYSKEIFTVTTPEGPRDVLVYLMNSEGVMPPTEAYYRRIVAGFRAHDMKLKPLREAKDRAWDDRNPSYKERRRYARAGRPRLAEASPIETPAVAAPKTDKREAQALPAPRDPKLNDKLDDIGREESSTPFAMVCKARVNRDAPKRKNLLDWLDERKQSGRGY